MYEKKMDERVKVPMMTITEFTGIMNGAIVLGKKIVADEADKNFEKALKEEGIKVNAEMLDQQAEDIMNKVKEDVS